MDHYNILCGCWGIITVSQLPDTIRIKTQMNDNIRNNIGYI